MCLRDPSELFYNEIVLQRQRGCRADLDFSEVSWTVVPSRAFESLLQGREAKEKPPAQPRAAVTSTAPSTRSPPRRPPPPQLQRREAKESAPPSPLSSMGRKCVPGGTSTALSSTERSRQRRQRAAEASRAVAPPPTALSNTERSQQRRQRAAEASRAVARARATTERQRLVDAQRQSGASAPPPSAPTDAELDDFEKAKALMARTKTSPALTDAGTLTTSRRL